MTVKRRKRSRRHRERGVRRGQERGRKIRRTGGKSGEVEREETLSNAQWRLNLSTDLYKDFFSILQVTS